MPVSNPFNPASSHDYQQWRNWKLSHAAQAAEQLIVEITDPRHVTDTEHVRLSEVIRANNMAIYAGHVFDEDKSIARLLGSQFGLEHLDHNFLADDDDITSLTVNNDKQH